MTDIHLDLETYSEVDLPKAGLYRYAEHESTEILMMAYAIDDGPIEIVDGYIEIQSKIRALVSCSVRS